MKTLKVEAVYPMAYQTLHGRHAPLHRIVTDARCSLSTLPQSYLLRGSNTPSARSKPQHDAVHRKGRARRRGRNWTVVIVYFSAN